MAEALISGLLGQLTSMTFKKIVKEGRLVLEIKEEVDKITSNLTAIQAVLVDAEKRQVKEAVVRDWLEKLKDVSYEMEDVLDEWNTEILIQQVGKQENEGENIFKTKVCFSIPSHCFCFGQVSRVIHRRDIARKIQDLNGRLNEIAEEKKTYNLHHIERAVIEEQHERFESSSFIDVSKIFGRENDRNIIMSRLLSESSQEGKGPIVIPIVGMGGIGKTTLAQLAYNDKIVKANFSIRLWICVSDSFHEIKIAKAILTYLVEKDDKILESNELEPLLQCIHEKIEGKKFFLVLDDVWNEDYRKWEPLKLSLQNGVVGNRILVTTRKEEVAMLMGSPTNSIYLNELSEQNCWSLFYHMALADREGYELKVLENIGKEIVKKCHGLPLIAKILGGLMRCKRTKKEWEDILNSEIWELDMIEQQVFPSLLLSYYDLSPIIKRCLLYCVMFPKDHNIDKDNLIELWMSQNYLNSNRSKAKKTMGQMYFTNLVMRSYFQDFEKNENGNVKCYKMHDIVHDFLQFLTKKECLLIEAKSGNEIIKLQGDKIRHLSLAFAPKGPFPISFSNCQNLWTLATFYSKITSFSRESILQLKCLRALNLSGNFLEELPSEVGGLLHLRYLNLSHNHDLRKLPDSLCNLFNLQTLRLISCYFLANLPEAMGKLTKLQHLRVRGCSRLNLLPIVRLQSLQTLDEVPICGEDDNEAEFKVSNLRNMDQLQGSLRISWWREVKDASDAKKAEMLNKKHILDLELSLWRLPSGNGQDDKIQEETLNALQPNPNLESLTIHNYRGNQLFPNWLVTLNNLKTLRFDCCVVCEFVPLLVLGNLVSLESLHFADMHEVKKVGFERLSGVSSSSSITLFPNLKHLSFFHMPEWVEWEGMKTESSADQNSLITIMPHLSFLQLTMCFKLKTLPDFLQNLSIEIYGYVKKDGVWNQQDNEDEEVLSQQEDKELSPKDKESSQEEDIL